MVPPSSTSGGPLLVSKVFNLQTQKQPKETMNNDLHITQAMQKLLQCLRASHSDAKLSIHAWKKHQIVQTETNQEPNVPNRGRTESQPPNRGNPSGNTEVF